MRKLEDWIEFMEGEGDLKKIAKIGILLKHSKTDHLILDNLRKLRRMVELGDPANNIEAAISRADFLSECHEKTMAAIFALNEKPSDRPRTKRSSDRDVGLSSSQGSCNS